MKTFDCYYKDYDAWYTTKMGAFVDNVESEAAFALLAPQCGQYILDAGCGTGNFSYKLANMGCNVVGIDVSDKMLGEAQAKSSLTHTAPTFKAMDCCCLSFPDNTFDSVISMSAFEFFEKPDVAAAEMMRVLKPGGILVIGVIQQGGLWQQLYTSEPFKDSVYSYASFKSKDDIISLSKEHFAEYRECLYTPPGLDEEEYSCESELLYKEKNDIGGFVCVKFRKV